jgi:predicted dehydrogenase
VATYIQHSSLVANGLHGAFNDEWWFDASRGGGILNAGGIHYIDRFLDWLGPIDAVSAVLQVTGDRPHDGAEDTYTAMFRFASGCVGLLQHCAAARGNPSRLCRVIGDAGSVWLEGGATWMAEDTPAREVAVPDDLRLPDPPPPSSDPKHAFTSIELPPYTRLAERWRDLILGLPVSPNAPVTPTFAAGLASQQVLDAMRASSLGNGAWVPVS